MKQGRHIHLLLILLIMAHAGCGAEGDPVERPPVEEPEELEAFMEVMADSYLHDRQWRRGQLEAMLWRPELPYARKLLDGYASPDGGGWDLLPEIDLEVAPIRADLPLDEQPFEPLELLPAELPEGAEAWKALGEEVFWSMPMRRDGYMEWLARTPEVWDEVGLQVDEDSETLRGLVRYRDTRGQVRVAATCGLCHGDQGQPGRAMRGLDLGLAREMYRQQVGLEPRGFDGWGAGRVDVTDDGADDPLAIPSLYGVAHQSHVNASASIRRHSPASLAVRFETQYTLNFHYEARPPRQLVWALAFFVQTLPTPRPVAQQASPEAEEVFGARCAGCHVPQRGFSGDPVAAAAMNSPQQAAHSTSRGTGLYRPPSLLGISRDQGPYLHDGSQPSLEALLSGGHPFGEPLEEQEIEAVLDYLKTL